MIDKNEIKIVAEGILHLHAPKGPHIEINGEVKMGTDGYCLELDGDAEHLEAVGSLAKELRKAKIDSEKKKLVNDYLESEQEANL